MENHDGEQLMIVRSRKSGTGASPEIKCSREHYNHEGTGRGGIVERKK